MKTLEEKTEKKDIFLTKRYFLNAVYKNEDKNSVLNLEKENKKLSKFFPPFEAESYEVFITIKGKISPSSGLIIQRDSMDKTIKKILSRYDRKFLNSNLKHFTGECLSEALSYEIKKTSLKSQFVSIELKKQNLNLKLCI